MGFGNIVSMFIVFMCINWHDAPTRHPARGECAVRGQTNAPHLEYSPYRDAWSPAPPASLAPQRGGLPARAARGRGVPALSALRVALQRGADRPAAAGDPIVRRPDAASSRDVGMTPRRVQTVGYLVWHLSPKWRIAVDRALRQFGLTHAHYLVLAGRVSRLERIARRPIDSFLSRRLVSERPHYDPRSTRPSACLVEEQSKGV